ncbi:MAG: alpha/beta hydrolase [Candidatus Thiodiazotropha sp. (ex. Lucinisca nassula)]|nr:alpha/beta hydrolase [Candidatus Thiodiazotropha sp. (ex. Lucinisca nassula)]
MKLIKTLDNLSLLDQTILSQNLTRTLLTSLIIILLGAGCSLLEISQQSQGVNQAGTISGHVDIESGSDAPVTILLFTKQEFAPKLERKYVLQGAGEFRFYAQQGTYYVAAFQDTNRDSLYQQIEPATLYGGSDLFNASPVVLQSSGHVELDRLVIKGPIANQTNRDNISFEIDQDHTGEIASLDDPRFSREIGSLGLWKPISFIDQVGIGLYMLSSSEAKRIPVIFIHGAGGTPLEFAELVDSLDSQRFEPWVLHYPSGLRLDIVSDYLVKSINQLESQYPFDNFYLIAHSMGGLVMRSTVKKYIESEHHPVIGLTMTINSPMDGMASAEFGARSSPIVIPSWRDIAQNSEFLRIIRDWPWPEEIPYHLVFSYQGGDSDDGVVDLESQIPLSLQAEATRLYGFHAGHATILTNPVFIQSFQDILNNSLL